VNPFLKIDMDPNSQDAYNVFGIRRPYTPSEQQWHREMERRSFDVIRVKNPDKEDFFLEYDHRFHKVPANGTADIHRYLAVNYCRDKAVDIINQINDKLHREDLEKREKSGLPRYKDKYEENWDTYMSNKYPKTNDKDLLTKIYSDLWIGLVYEFGKDEPVFVDKRSGEVDLTPLELKILRTLEGRRVDISSEEKKVQEEKIFTPFDKPSKEVMEKEVLNETKTEPEGKGK
jgi:hypothetical protein